MKPRRVLTGSCDCDSQGYKACYCWRGFPGHVVRLVGFGVVCRAPVLVAGRWRGPAAAWPHRGAGDPSPSAQASSLRLAPTGCCSMLRNSEPAQNDSREPLCARFLGRRTRKTRSTSADTSTGLCRGTQLSSRARVRRGGFRVYHPRRCDSLRHRRESRSVHPAAVWAAALLPANTPGRGEQRATAGLRSEGRKPTGQHAPAPASPGHGAQTPPGPPRRAVALKRRSQAEQRATLLPVSDRCCDCSKPFCALGVPLAFPALWPVFIFSPPRVSWLPRGWGSFASGM